MSAEQLLTSGLQQGASSVMTGVSNFGQYMLLPPAPNPLAQAPGMNTVQYSVNNLTQQVNPLMLQMQNAIGWYTPPAGVSRQQYARAIQQQAQLDRDRYTLQMMRNPTAPLDALGMVGGAAWSLEMAVPALSKVGAIAGAATVGKLYMADMLIGGAARALHRGYLGATTEGGMDATDVLMGTGRLGELQKQRFQQLGLDELAETSGVLPGLFRMGMNQTLFKRPADFVQRTAFKDIVSKSSHLMTAANPGVIGGRGFSEEQYGDIYRELKNVARETPGVKFEDVINQFGHNMQSGEYSNASDMQDFKRRVQSIKSELKYLKEVGKVTGESAADLRNEMQRLKRELGVSGPDAFAAYKLGSQPLGAISGVGTSGIQMGGVQGAQLFKSQGFDADYGYISGQRMTALAGMTRQRGGSMNDQQWDNIGGVHGFAGAMMQNSAQLLSSNVGTTLIAGLATKDASGRMSIDPVKLRRLQEGRLPLQEILSQGSQLLTSEGTVGGNRLKVLANIDELAKGMPAEEPLMFAIKAMEEQVYLAAPELRGAKDEASRKAIAMGVSEAARTQLGVNFNTQQAMAYLDLSRDRMKYVEEQQRYLRVQQRRAREASRTSPMLGDAARLFGKLGVSRNTTTGLLDYAYSDLDETPQEKLAKDRSAGFGAISALATFGAAAATTGLTTGAISPFSMPALGTLAVAAGAYHLGSYLADSVNNTLNPQQRLIDEVRASQRESFIRQQAFAMEYRAWSDVPYSLTKSPGVLQSLRAYVSGDPDASPWEAVQNTIQRGNWGRSRGGISPYVPTWDEAAASGDLYTKDTDYLRAMASRNFFRDAAGAFGNTALTAGTFLTAKSLAMYGIRGIGGLLAGGTLMSTALPIAALAGGAYITGKYLIPQFDNLRKSSSLRHTWMRIKNLGGDLTDDQLAELQGVKAVEVATEALGADKFAERGLSDNNVAVGVASQNVLNLYTGLGTPEAAEVMAKKYGKNIFIENAFDTKTLEASLEAGKGLPTDVTNVEELFTVKDGDKAISMFDIPEEYRQAAIPTSKVSKKSGLAEVTELKSFGKLGTGVATDLLSGAELDKAATAKRLQMIMRDPTLSGAARYRKVLEQLQKEVTENVTPTALTAYEKRIQEKRAEYAQKLGLGASETMDTLSEWTNRNLSGKAAVGITAATGVAAVVATGGAAAPLFAGAFVGVGSGALVKHTIGGESSVAQSIKQGSMKDTAKAMAELNWQETYLSAFAALKARKGFEDLTEPELIRMFNETGFGTLRGLGLGDEELAPLINEMRGQVAGAGAVFDTDIFSTKVAERFIYGKDNAEAGNRTAISRVAGAIADVVSVGKGQRGRTDFINAIGKTALESSETMSALFDFGKRMQGYQKRIGEIDAKLSPEQRAARQDLMYAEFLKETKDLRGRLNIDDTFMSQEALGKESSDLTSGLRDMETFTKYKIADATYSTIEDRLRDFKGDILKMTDDPKRQAELNKRVTDMINITQAKGRTQGGEQATAADLAKGLQAVVDEVVGSESTNAAKTATLKSLMTRFGMSDSVADAQIKKVLSQGNVGNVGNVLLGQSVIEASQEEKLKTTMTAGGVAAGAPISQDVLENLQRAIDGLSGVKNYFADQLNVNTSKSDVPGTQALGDSTETK